MPRSGSGDPPRADRPDACATFLAHFLILLAAWVLAIVFGIMAALAANKGEFYTYPLSIKFLR